jgi:hypothetical protein
VGGRRLQEKEKEMSQLNQLEKILMQNLYITAGLAPCTDVFQDMTKMLSTLSVDEQRKAKRKFRKMWRKLAASKSHPFYAIKSLGLGSTHPTKAQKKARKWEVDVHMTRKMISIKRQINAAL